MLGRTPNLLIITSGFREVDEVNFPEGRNEVEF